MKQTTGEEIPVARQNILILAKCELFQIQHYTRGTDFVKTVVLYCTFVFHINICYKIIVHKYSIIIHINRLS